MKIILRTTLATAAIALGAATALAQEADLAAALAAVRDAALPERAAAVARVVSLKPVESDVGKALADGLPAPAVKAGWHELEAVDGAGVARPYHLYVPESAPTGEALPLLVEMHGGVSRPEYLPDEMFRKFREGWRPLADEHGFVLAVPKARGDCTWWSAAGVSHLRAVVRDAKRHAWVDDDSVVGTGFSDGGSGCWFLAMGGAHPFAALMPMNGSPQVAVRASEQQLYLRNAASIPLFVAMTQDDGLYPGATVLPHVQALFEANAAVHLVSYPTGGHTPSYFDDLSGAFGAFVTDQVRDALPRSIDWQFATAALGRVGWFEALEVGPAAADAESPDAQPADDLQVQSRPGRVMVGVRIDPDYPGEGVKVAAVVRGRPAHDLGMHTGDVIVGINGIPITKFEDLRAVLGAAKWGEPIEIRVRRGDETEPRVLKGDLPGFEPRPSYPRTLPTAHVSIRVSGNFVDVKSRNLRRFRLLLSPALFDLREELTVVVNGIVRSRAKPTVDLAAGLRRFAADADSSRWFPASVDVSVD